MPPVYKPITLGPFLKGLYASTDPYTNPKGSLPRGSNFIFTSRGSLDNCDGTLIINAFNGQPQANRGRMKSVTLFQPTGVPPYYLVVAKVLSAGVGTPHNLGISDGGPGGTLPGGTYYYVVTAVDGVGGETPASNEVFLSIPSNELITLTWNVVPNAFGYNLYRGPAPGGENSLLTRGLPILQVPAGTTTVTVNDDGSAVPFTATPPVVDTTQQVGLYKMPAGTVPVTYTDGNIVAFFPASSSTFGAVPTGGSGGSGGTGPGIGGLGASTPSGGIVGLTGLLPQMVQFTNRIILALGNGFAPQIYYDSTGTSVNPAPTGAISTISATSDGVVSITMAAPHGLIPAQSGANIIIAGVPDSVFNGTYTTIAVASTTVLQVVNLAAASHSSTGGTFTLTTSPITNTFVPAFPAWATGVNYAVGSIIVPTVANGFYYKAVQPGISSTPEPTFPTTPGVEVPDGGQLVWVNAGPTTGPGGPAPSPPGAGHVIVYSGSLWVWDTYPINVNGLDGPTALRMSDVNNPLSWNPINQAFIDKDDGTEGMGLATFTISAQGIPPEGSLVAFKNYSAYQILGVFGSSNFAIQRIKSDMGCIAPRSILFVPGYGIVRYSHMGASLFNGVDDNVISEEIRPFLFPVNDQIDSDITVVDANWIPAAMGSLTANPPMYVFAAPIGSSNGALTRLFCYDLTLKCWTTPIDLPFAISAMFQARPTTSNPITLFAGFNDGVLQRWQAGDVQWYTGAAGAFSPSQVAWNAEMPDVAAPNPDLKLTCRRIALRGISSGPTSITVTPRIGGVLKVAQTYRISGTGDFEVFAGVLMDGLRFSATISGTGNIELDRVIFHVSPKSIGVPLVIS